ncbi:MAG: hypothetical protein KUG53_00105 [Pseudomonadales bacterium]|nr:hypothetical protein [Pseudomonadales bacterium]
MRKVILTFCLLLTSCSSVVINKHISDEELTRKIIGVWAQEVGEDSYVRFYNAYWKEGIIHGFGYDYGAPNSKDNWFQATGDWQVRNGYSCYKLFETSRPESVPIGSEECNKIVSVSKDKYVFESSEGIRNTMYRVTDSTCRSKRITIQSISRLRRRTQQSCAGY